MTKKDEKQWGTMLANVVSDMRSYVSPYLTPIAKGVNYNLGKLHGTGSFWELKGRHYLLTCEHVASEHKKHPQPGLSYLPDPNKEYIRCGCFVSVEEPEDLALFWNVNPPTDGKAALIRGRLASSSETVEGELLFICGFPQQNSTPVPTQLFTRGLPYGCQKSSLPNCNRFHSNFHFAVRYPSFDVQSVEGESTPLPDPHALSGSLVWSTEFVRSGCSSNWQPSQAKIIGVVWCWSQQGECLVATKVESLTAFLLQALQEECARERWESGGKQGIKPSEEEVKFAQNKIKTL